MKAKRILPTILTVSTIFLTATTAYATKTSVKKVKAIHDGKSMQIEIEMKGSADGVVVEAFTNKKATKKSKLFSISSKPKERTTTLYDDDRYAYVMGKSNGYEMSGYYFRYGNWSGKAHGRWQKTKNVKSAEMQCSFDNSKTKMVVYLELNKKLKNGKSLYVRTTPLNGKRAGKKGNVSKAKKVRKFSPETIMIRDYANLPFDYPKSPNGNAYVIRLEKQSRRSASSTTG